MTTNIDIVYEQLYDALIQCEVRGLVKDTEVKDLRADLELWLSDVEVKKANQEQITWNQETI